MAYVLPRTSDLIVSRLQEHIVNCFVPRHGDGRYVFDSRYIDVCGLRVTVAEFDGYVARHGCYEHVSDPSFTYYLDN